MWLHVATGVWLITRVLPTQVLKAQAIAEGKIIGKQLQTAPSEVPDYEPFDRPDGEHVRQLGVVAMSPSCPPPSLPPSLSPSLPPFLPPSFLPQTLAATTVATMNCLLCSLTRDAPAHQVITWGGYATGKVRREERVRVDSVW